MHPFYVPRFRLSLTLFVCLAVLGTETLWGAKNFTLEAVRTELTFGPYELRDSSHVTVDGERYQMRIRSSDRLSFISLATGRVYGPVQAVDGRLLELSGKMYAFAWTSDKKAPAIKPSTETERGIAPPSSAPPPPPRPVSIPIPPVATAAPPRPRTTLPPVAKEWRAMAWMAPLHDTPMKWKVNGLSSGDHDISRFTLGGAMMWHGWTASLGLSPSVSGGKLLPQGMSVQKADLDDGTGWALGFGYQRPFLQQGRWQAVGGARLAISQDKLDLKSRTAFEQKGTNNTSVVDYKSHTSSVTLTEYALWLDLSLLYSQDFWGLYANLSLLPLGSVDVDGKLPLNHEKLSIDAERDHPLAFGFGGWFGVSPWRGFADYTMGTEKRLRIGAMYDF